MKGEIKIPFQFNPIKHHIQYIRQFCSFMRTDFDERNFFKGIQKIGCSISDIYTGKLSVKDILSEIEFILKAEGIFDFSSYSQFMEKREKMYYNLMLSDGSKWTLRLGEEEIRYIHIHPTRKSSYNLRFPASTIKSAIFALLFAKEETGFDLKKLNDCRKKYADLPPLVSLAVNGRIAKLTELIEGG